MKITIIALLAIISIATANGRGQCMGRGCGLGFTPVVQVQYDYTTGIESDPTTQGRIYNSTPNTTDIVTRIKYHIPNYGPQTGCRLNFGGPNGTIHGEGNFDFYGTLKEADGQLNTSAFPSNIRETLFARANTIYVARDFGKRPSFGEWFSCANQTIIAEFVGVGEVDISWDAKNSSSGPTMEWM
jgi:hypothetical protein